MSASAILNAWHDHLSNAQRRSPHTVRAYVATAERLIEATGLVGWSEIARLDATALRQQLARRRASFVGKTIKAEDLRLVEIPSTGDDLGFTITGYKCGY